MLRAVGCRGVPEEVDGAGAAADIEEGGDWRAAMSAKVGDALKLKQELMERKSVGDPWNPGL